MCDGIEDRECAVCHGEATQRCSACHAAYYCSFEHQKQHWKSHRRQCLPVIVAQRDPGRVPYWVAGRDIKPGSSILKEAPALRWPAWPRLNGNNFNLVPCLTCGKFLQFQTPEWQPCSLCGWPVCSTECEQASIHKDGECTDFVTHGIAFPPKTGRDLSKMLDYTIALIRMSKLKVTNLKKYEEILTLCPEPAVIHDTKHLALFHEILMRFSCFLNRNVRFLMSYPELRQAIWVLKLNRFSCSREGEIDFPGEGPENIGMNCIYLKTSLLSKSCSPNCSHAISPMPPDFSMVVRAAVLIREEEPLTIVRRGGDAMPTVRRQKELRQQFEFICQCKRCIDPTELNTYMSAMVCPACRKINGRDKNPGYMLPVDPLSVSDTAVWKCNSCEEIVTAADFLPGIYELADAISEDVEDVELFEEIVRVNSNNFLHPNHWVLQMAISGILDYYQENGCPLQNIKHFTELTLYRMNIEDVLNPGISFNRANFQRDYLIVIWPIIEGQFMQNAESARNKFSEEIRICMNFVYEAHRYFELFQSSLSDGEFNLKVLTAMKSSMESMNEEEDPSEKMATLSIEANYEAGTAMES
ncbi:unnamed protein product [Allacma fusca]|uniref:MYND-type domain-containing protein n=1 Tax=Allacma fusca TaxID=39272 RepID=A0A8J2L2I3_9HEXA|nr:unnamed protein product [Allacma fusca]